LEHRLNAYAVAATAAGVGALCSGQAAEAKVVYTPANVNIPQNRVMLVDLNHDSIPDFKLHNPYFVSGSGYPFAELSIGPENGNEVRDRRQLLPVGLRLCCRLAQRHENRT
jgi:hypothetical protein